VATEAPSPVSGAAPLAGSDAAPERGAVSWARRFGVVAWPSFFSAGVATTVFFAFVDPLQLRDITFPGMALTREAGYTIAFFLFWSATAGSSLFTSFLSRVPDRTARTDR
jgi:hypothetical protein